jgi:HSP20 family protein
VQPIGFSRTVQNVDARQHTRGIHARQKHTSKEAIMTTKELTGFKSSKSADLKTSATHENASGFNPFDFLQREIDRVFDAFSGMPAALNGHTFMPRLEVADTDGTIHVSAELPGMDEKDVEINVADGALTIRGEKKIEKDEKRKNYRLVERSYGSFERIIALPNGVDPAKVKAKMVKGVLQIDIPKPSSAKGQQIKIAAE